MYSHNLVVFAYIIPPVEREELESYKSSIYKTIGLGVGIFPFPIHEIPLDV